MSEMIMTAVPAMLTAIGALAFVVSIITEVFKNVGALKRIPTDVVVIVLSVVVTLAALFMYASYIGMAVMWYYVVAAFIASFFVAFVAMYGWEKFSDLWARFGK